MEREGNDARFIRSAASRLEEIAEQYPWHSKENDEISDVAAQVRNLAMLPDPPDEQDGA